VYTKVFKCFLCTFNIFVEDRPRRLEKDNQPYQRLELVKNVDIPQVALIVRSTGGTYSVRISTVL
jgi:hypothetical protein